MRHIRTTDRNVKDHRFRSAVLYANKLRPVLCGGEPSSSDVSRADAEHFMSPSVRALTPEWSADLCPECTEKLAARKAVRP